MSKRNIAQMHHGKLNPTAMCMSCESLSNAMIIHFKTGNLKTKTNANIATLLPVVKYWIK